MSDIYLLMCYLWPPSGPWFRKILNLPLLIYNPHHYQFMPNSTLTRTLEIMFYLIRTWQAVSAGKCPEEGSQATDTHTVRFPSQLPYGTGWNQQHSSSLSVPTSGCACFKVKCSITAGHLWISACPPPEEHPAPHQVAANWTLCTVVYLWGSLSGQGPYCAVTTSVKEAVNCWCWIKLNMNPQGNTRHEERMSLNPFT